MSQQAIWNPNAQGASKTVIDVGSPIPEGYQIWTGGTASEEQARQAIHNAPNPSNPFGISNARADAEGYNRNNVIGINESINEIDQGSENIRDDTTQLNNNLQGTLGEMDDTGAQTDIDLLSAFEDLQEQRRNIASITEQELAQIESAGEAAGMAYNPLIADAEESALYGQARNVVATGRRGGFQRTRYAGEAALGPTIGDVGYEGSGGRLEATASAYKRNINALKDQKMRAIELAKAQARQAIQGGKQQDFNNARDMLAFARQLREDQRQAEQEWNNYILKERQEQRADDKFKYDIYKDQRDYEQGIDRFERTQAVQEGWLGRSISEDQRKQAQENIIFMANSGEITLDQIPEEMRTELEIMAGFEPGTFDAIYNRAFYQARMGDTMDILKLQKAQADLTKSLRVGSGGGGGGNNLTLLGTTLAKDYFSKSNIAKGANNADISISEFGNLTVDEANKYISGGGFDQIYVDQRANSFINDTGEIDWNGIEELKNVDKDLYKKVVKTITNEQKRIQGIIEKQETKKTEEQKKRVESGKYYIDEDGDVAIKGEKVKQKKEVKPEDLITISGGDSKNDSQSFWGKLFGF